jgi:hypothetical protein
MKGRNMSNRCLITGFVMLIMVSMLGCDSSGPPLDIDPDSDYQIQGAVVVEMNPHITTAVAQNRRDGDILPSTKVIWSGDTLAYVPSVLGLDSVHYHSALSITAYPVGGNPLEIADGTSFSDTALLMQPDTFLITSITPGNRIINGGTVGVVWSGSANVDGYIVASVHRGRAYNGTGHSAYSTSLATQASIPWSAFLLPDGINPDIGWHDIYIYGYTGSPDSALTTEFLPVPLPGQLADNIVQLPLTGRFGSVMVARHDSILVAIL